MASLKSRILHLKKIMREERFDALLISSVPVITYLTGFSNFSKDEREAYLVILKDSQFILTDGRYTTAVKKQVKDFTLLELSSLRQFTTVIKELLEKYTIKTLGIEGHNLTVSEYESLKPYNVIVHQVNLQQLRIKKDANEIQTIQKACKLGDDAFQYLSTQIRPGLTEKKISFLLEMYIKEHEADLAFTPIIAFNENAAAPHHQTGNTQIKPHSLILLDFGVKVGNYCSDMTRTIFLGKATNEQKKMYDTVLDAQQNAIDRINSLLNDTQIPAADIDKAARDYILSQGYPSIPHALGHGIGLEVHEPPTLSPLTKSTLENGMVFSIEPGIYIPDEAGIRIEDLFAIEHNTLRQLTNSPKSLIEI